MSLLKRIVPTINLNIMIVRGSLLSCLVVVVGGGGFHGGGGGGGGVVVVIRI